MIWLRLIYILGETFLVWLKHYYSPTEIMIRRKEKEIALRSQSKKELTKALLENNLMDLSHYLIARTNGLRSGEDKAFTRRRRDLLGRRLPGGENNTPSRTTGGEESPPLT